MCSVVSERSTSRRSLEEFDFCSPCWKGRGVSMGLGGGEIFRKGFRVGLGALKRKLFSLGCANGGTVQVYVKKPVICAQSLENILKSTFLFFLPFLFFRERGAGPGASRAYGRDGRTDGPKSFLLFSWRRYLGEVPMFCYVFLCFLTSDSDSAHRNLSGVKFLR